VSVRCTVAALERGDDRAGTASTFGSWLLVEHAGPWGQDAFRDARMPEGVGTDVLRRASRARLRPLLVRSGVRESGRTGVRVLAGWSRGAHPWLEETVLPDLTGLGEVDVEGLGRGVRPGWGPAAGPQFLVCTHGRHDVCCAERGRPVAGALRDAGVPGAWEVSHIGGDRFAANMLVLPEGLYYGGLDEDSVVAVAQRHRQGLLTLDLLRGRSAYAMPVQYAEVALRRELGEERDTALRLVHRRREADRWRAVFAHGGRQWEVVVATEQGEPAYLTCSARRPSPVPRHRVVSMGQTGSGPTT
jgi:hypothetical protein